MLPLARESDLHLQEVGEDLVVYDLRSQAVHSLNAAAAYVWQQCDGCRSTAEIAAAARAAGLDWNEATVADVVSQLQSQQLLEPAIAPRTGTPRLTRRVLAKAALAALVPAIVSVAAPSAAVAQSFPPDVNPPGGLPPGGRPPVVG